MKKLLIIVPLVATLFGCATGYHPMLLNGGFEDFKLANDTYLVKFRGNGYTSQDLAFKYTLRRAAELTKEKGYKYFKIIGSSSDINRSFYRTPITANTTSNSTGSVFGNYGYGQYNAYANSTSNSTTTFSGGDLVEIEKPVSYIAIKLSEHHENGLLDADVILSNFKK